MLTVSILTDWFQAVCPAQDSDLTGVDVFMQWTKQDCSKFDRKCCVRHFDRFKQHVGVGFPEFRHRDFVNPVHSID